MVRLQSLPSPGIDQTLLLIYPKKRYGDSHFHDRAVDLWDDLGLEDDGPSLGAPPRVPMVTRDPLCEERKPQKIFCAVCREAFVAYGVDDHTIHLCDSCQVSINTTKG